jgi:2,3-bisphosphoglycerate-dependent phosphoglycerate mutase
MTTLILIRHGQSLWNALNKFTGWVDVPLSERGRAEATIASCRLRGYRVNLCFTSKLIRAIETAMICLTEQDDICDGKIPIIKHEQADQDWHGWDDYAGNPAEELPIFTNAALDERYYGELQGLNKAETAEKYGKEQVQEWRRSYSVRPPGGESSARRKCPCCRPWEFSPIDHHEARTAHPRASYAIRTGNGSADRL